MDKAVCLVCLASEYQQGQNHYEARIPPEIHCCGYIRPSVARDIKAGEQQRRILLREDATYMKKSEMEKHKDESVSGHECKNHQLLFAGPKNWPILYS